MVDSFRRPDYDICSPLAGLKDGDYLYDINHTRYEKMTRSLVGRICRPYRNVEGRGGGGGGGQNRMGGESVDTNCAGKDKGGGSVA